MNPLKPTVSTFKQGNISFLSLLVRSNTKVHAESEKVYAFIWDTEQLYEADWG